MKIMAYSREQLASMNLGREIFDVVRDNQSLVERIVSLYEKNLHIPEDVIFKDYELYRDNVWSYERIAEQSISDVYAHSSEVSRAVVGKLIRTFLPLVKRRKIVKTIKKMTAFQVAHDYDPAFSLMPPERIKECGISGRKARGLLEYSDEQRRFILDWENTHSQGYRRLMELTNAFNGTFGTSKSKCAIDSLRRRLNSLS